MEDYVTNLDDQSEQFFERIQDAQMAIEPFIDLEEDSEIDHHSGDCFVDFAQLPEPTPNVNALRMRIVNDMHGIGEEAMTSHKMLVARRLHLGGKF